MIQRTILFAIQIATLLAFSTPVFANSTFPQGPDLRETPGALCTHPDSYRYPEHIPYCKRNVSSGEKRQVIEDYNQKLGYDIQNGDRQQFKIDHLIPLCMGGANDESNLWPQHESIYQQTDPIEPLACQKMSEGKLLQARAVELIIQAKTHLDQVPQVMAVLQAL